MCRAGGSSADSMRCHAPDEQLDGRRANIKVSKDAPLPRFLCIIHRCRSGEVAPACLVNR
jgi:hypothetical protein